MKKKQFFALIGLTAMMLVAFTFNSCKKDDDDPAEALITEFAITNAGAGGNLRVEGVINNLNILVVVPFETDRTALITDIKLSPGASVVPASGTPQNFTTPRVFVVTNAGVSNNYNVVVELAAPTSGVISTIKFKSASSGEVYESAIDQAGKKITVTFNDLQNPLAVIDEMTLFPAGSTYATSSATDTLNLSAAQTITVSYAGAQTVYQIIANITEAGFDPAKTSALLDKSGKSSLVPSIINNENTRGAAFDGRYVYLASRKDGNFVYVYDAENPTADPTQLALTGTVSGGTWLVSDVRTVGANIYVSNMVMNASQVFKVYKWEGKDDAEPELILEYTVPDANIRLGDAISVIGNPPANGYIFASNFAWPNNASEFYVWNFNTKSADPVIMPIQPLAGLRMGQYGRVNVIPNETGKLLVSGAEMGVAVMDYNGTILYETSEPMVQSRSYDPRIFEYNGGLYLSYVVNREWEGSTAEDKGVYYDIINITEGGTLLEKLQNLNNNNIAQKRVFRHNFGSGAAVWVGATHGIGFSSSGKPRAMSFALNNGFIVHEFTN